MFSSMITSSCPGRRVIGSGFSHNFQANSEAASTRVMTVVMQRILFMAVAVVTHSLLGRCQVDLSSLGTGLVVTVCAVARLDQAPATRSRGRESRPCKLTIVGAHCSVGVR